MKTIWKFAAPIDDSIRIEMPFDADVLSVQMQGHDPQVWALVDPEKKKFPRTFHWRGTGHPADGLGRFVGTVQTNGLVFHLFEHQS